MGGKAYNDEVELPSGPLSDSQEGAQIADPGDSNPIPVTTSGTVGLSIGGGAETNSLPDPARAGINLMILVQYITGGSRAITSTTPINAAGNNRMTFDAVREFIKLVSVQITSVPDFAWQVVESDGVTLTSV